jgi:hypothetical protein
LVLVFGLLPALVLVSGLGANEVVVLGPEGPWAWDGDAAGLRCLPPCQLEQLYAQGCVRGVPIGWLPGGLLVMTDFPFPRATVRVSQRVWRGKHVEPDGHFINQFNHFQGMPSQAFIEPSWYDGQPCIVMQYPKGTPLFANIRDEFREIAPGLLLGRVYQRRPFPKHLGFMYMQACPCSDDCPAPASE